jgi:hypothetical protein
MGAVPARSLGCVFALPLFLCPIDPATSGLRLVVTSRHSRKSLNRIGCELNFYLWFPQLLPGTPSHRHSHHDGDEDHDGYCDHD